MTTPNTTPRTDKAKRTIHILSSRCGLARSEYDGGILEYVTIDDYRQLETELNELKQNTVSLAEWEVTTDKLTTTQAECAAMREALECGLYAIQNDDSNQSFAVEAINQSLSTTAGKELLERLEKAEEDIRVIATDTNYVGGVQYWIGKHDKLMLLMIPLFEERDQLRAQVEELSKSYENAVNYSNKTAKLDAENIQLRTRQKELLKIAEKILQRAKTKDAYGRSVLLEGVESELTAFKEGK